MASTQTKSSPFGVLNLKAAAEASLLLQESKISHHQQLNHWLIENYLPDPLCTVVSNDEEPLGRRIRSVEDLGALVVAYSNARALKQKISRRGMDHELYFHGQLPDRERAIEAGNAVRTQFNPSAKISTGSTLHERVTQ